MKSLIGITILTIGLLTVAGVRESSAQIDTAIDFTTTFPFMVGNTTLPAGNYSIAPVDDEEQTLELKGGKTAVLFMTESAQAKDLPAKSEIVFRKYGNQYVLKNIWVEGTQAGFATEKSVGERHLAKSDAAPTESRVAARKSAKKTTTKGTK